MPDARGISGLAVALAAAGGWLVYAGIRDVPIVEGLRELAAGQMPAGRAARRTPVSFGSAVGSAVAEAAKAGAAAVAGGGSLGPRIAAAAREYIGVPYRWAGHTPAGWDCSGFVTYVLVHDVGLKNLPNQTHTVTGQYLVWPGARTIGRDQCSSGDLVCWPGHIGIAIDRDNMINAPHPGAVTRIDKIWGVPTIRRVAG